MIKSTVLGLGLAVMSLSSAMACNVVYGFWYQMDDGAYRTSLNGVFLNRTTDPGDYSGGGSFYQWLTEGENVFALTMEQGSATVRVTRGCEGDFETETLVEAEVAAGDTKELTFFAESAPAAVYDDNGALSQDGLADAVSALKAATTAKDLDSYVTLHQGLIMQAAASGFPEEAMKGMMAMALSEGAATMADNLVYTPVIGGKVWQVMTSDYEAPITIKIESEGMTMETGVFWTKIDGQWRVTGS